MPLTNQNGCSGTEERRKNEKAVEKTENKQCFPLLHSNFAATTASTMLPFENFFRIHPIQSRKLPKTNERYSNFPLDLNAN
jgi:hypothetical protein